MVRSERDEVTDGMSAVMVTMLKVAVHQTIIRPVLMMELKPGP